MRGSCESWTLQGGQGKDGGVFQKGWFQQGLGRLGGQGRPGLQIRADLEDDSVMPQDISRARQRCSCLNQRGPFLSGDV